MEYESYLESPTNLTPPDTVGKRKMCVFGAELELLQTTDPLRVLNPGSLGAALHSTLIWSLHLFYSPVPQTESNLPPLVPKPLPLPADPLELQFPPHRYRILRTRVLEFPLGCLEPH